MIVGMSEKETLNLRAQAAGHRRNARWLIISVTLHGFLLPALAGIRRTIIQRRWLTSAAGRVGMDRTRSVFPGLTVGRGAELVWTMLLTAWLASKTGGRELAALTALSFA